MDQERLKTTISDNLIILIEDIIERGVPDSSSPNFFYWKNEIKAEVELFVENISKALKSYLDENYIQKC